MTAEDKEFKNNPDIISLARAGRAIVDYVASVEAGDGKEQIEKTIGALNDYYAIFSSHIKKAVQTSRPYLLPPTYTLIANDTITVESLYESLCDEFCLSPKNNLFGLPPEDTAAISLETWAARFSPVWRVFGWNLATPQPTSLTVHPYKNSRQLESLAPVTFSSTSGGSFLASTLGIFSLEKEIKRMLYRNIDAQTLASLFTIQGVQKGKLQKADGLICDLDGVLVTLDNDTNPKTVAMLKSAQEKGLPNILWSRAGKRRATEIADRFCYGDLQKIVYLSPGVWPYYDPDSARWKENIVHDENLPAFIREYIGSTSSPEHISQLKNAHWLSLFSQCVNPVLVDDRPISVFGALASGYSCIFMPENSINPELVQKILQAKL